MNEARYTPGPWVTEPEEASEGRGIVIGSPSSDSIVATITPDDDLKADDIDWANARLMAAAPDLLRMMTQAMARVDIANREGDPINGNMLPWC